MAASFTGRLRSYADVLLLFTIAGIYLPITIVFHPLLLIFSPSTFRSKWFENMWSFIGSRRAAKGDQDSPIDGMLSKVSGVVLEVGPGTGDQMYHYRADQIDKLYAAEPNKFMHEKLVGKARASGLEGKFIPMVAGAQPDSLIPALQREGLIPKGFSTLPDEGVFDYIVSIKVLCSVPSSQTTATVAIIQRLLKPQGEFIFFEHVENNSDSLTRWIVYLFGRIWTLFAGGCRIDSKLDKAVLSMGGWAERRVQTVEPFEGYEIMRFVKGVCVKA